MSESDDRAGGGMLRYLIGLGLLLAVGVFALVYYQQRTAGPGSIAVLEFDGDGGEALSAALREALSQDFDLVTPESHASGESAQELLESGQAGVVISGELPQTRRFQAVHAYLHDADGRQLIWSDSMHYSALRPYMARVAGDIAQAARLKLGAPQDEKPRFFPSLEVQQEYLSGRLELDKPLTEAAIDQARRHFESALSKAPEYAKARAGLCEALLQQGLLSGEQSLLEEAEKECESALRADPTPAEAHTASGNLLRETGRLDEAQAVFDSALKRDAYHTDAYLGLAQTHARVYLAAESGGDAYEGLAQTHPRPYLTTKSEEAAQQAVERAQQAVDTYDYFWKSSYVLSRILDITGDKQGAIDAGEEAKTLQANERVLNHLGSLYLCQGNYSRALGNYQKASESSGSSNRADAGVGATQYLLGEHEEAARLLTLAAAKTEEAGRPVDHRVWAYLGDSLRQLSKDTEAVQAYEKAAEAIRDEKSGDRRVYEAYYHAALAHLDAARKTQQSSREIETWLRGAQDGASDSAELRRIAEAWVLMRQMIQARAAYDKLKEQCPGYASAPDLAVLQES